MSSSSRSGWKFGVPIMGPWGRDERRLHSHGRRKSGAALVLPQQKSAARLLGLFGWFRSLAVLFSGHCPLPTARYRLVPVGAAIAFPLACLKVQHCTKYCTLPCYPQIQTSRWCWRAVWLRSTNRRDVTPAFSKAAAMYVNTDGDTLFDVGFSKREAREERGTDTDEAQHRDPDASRLALRRHHRFSGARARRARSHAHDGIP